MTFLSYSLAVLVAFSGLFVGAVLAFTTKEELATGKKYFPWMQRLLVLSIAAVTLHFLEVPLLYKIIIYPALLFLLLGPAIPVYPLLAFFLFLSGISQESLFIVSALIFLHGFPVGSMLVIEQKKMGWKSAFRKILAGHGLFVPLALILQVGSQFR